MARVILSPKEAANLKLRVAATRPLTEIAANPTLRGQDRRKYANEIVEDPVHGRFDSKAEHRRWHYLLMLAKGGRISDLRRQVRFELVPKQSRPQGGFERAVHYVADFVYVGEQGAQVVEDVKGASTPEYRLKRKLMLWRHGIEVKEVRS